MEYKAYLKQSGEGCDYTIGCAQLVINIEANNIEEAKHKLSLIIIDDYGQFDEVSLSSAELYEVNEVFKMPVEEIYAKNNELKRKNTEIEQEKLDAIEFERLKKKFN